MEFYLKSILYFALILLVVALLVAVIQVILMLLDLKWASHELRKRAKTIVDIYDAVALLGSTSWKTFLKRFRKVLTKFFGGDEE